MSSSRARGTDTLGCPQNPRRRRREQEKKPIDHRRYATVTVFRTMEQRFSVGIDMVQIRWNYGTMEQRFSVGIQTMSRYATVTWTLLKLTYNMIISNDEDKTNYLIGEIIDVKSIVTDPPQDKNRVIATIKMDNDMSVTMSLFDSQAVKIHNPLEVSTPRWWEESNQTEATLPADTGLTPAAPLLRGYAKVESLSVAENDFVLTASMAATYSVTLNFRPNTKSSLGSDTCSLSVRHRVEMSVADGEALFVCFDGAGDGVNLDETQAPPFVSDMGGDVDNGDDNPGAVSVPTKVEAGGSSQAQGAGQGEERRKA
ncbi:hypothetical protein Rs2_29384 [Raphanus sativus]|nr:hypothetical protein Rs2_29384 [Raphanus sativus]